MIFAILEFVANVLHLGSKVLESVWAFAGELVLNVWSFENVTSTILCLVLSMKQRITLQASTAMHNKISETWSSWIFIILVSLEIFVLALIIKGR